MLKIDPKWKFSDPTILDDWKVKMLNFHFGSIFNMHYIVGFLSYKHDSKNKNDQQTLIISNLIIFLARAHFRARVHFINLLQKWHFFTFSKHTATCLEISARASARQSMRMQKLNLFYIYIVLITSKLTLLWPCKVSRKFSKTVPPRTFEPPWAQHEKNLTLLSNLLINVDF